MTGAQIVAESSGCFRSDTTMFWTVSVGSWSRAVTVLFVSHTVDTLRNQMPKSGIWWYFMLFCFGDFGDSTAKQPGRLPPSLVFKNGRSGLNGLRLP